jgi:hypothetical protein
MTSERELQAVEARVAEATGDVWEPGQDADGAAIVQVRFGDGRNEVMRFTRDGLPADRGDIQFIAYARRDLRRLLAAARGKRALGDEEVAEIETRLAHASPGPWRAFVEEDGGLGGCDVISVSDEDGQPDLYIWVAGKLAPSADFRLVAAARQDIPDLLAAVRSSRRR